MALRGASRRFSRITYVQDFRGQGESHKLPDDPVNETSRFWAK